LIACDTPFPGMIVILVRGVASAAGVFFFMLEGAPQGGHEAGA
jgi:hypothetical protein